MYVTPGRDTLRGGELVIGAVGECRNGRIVGLDFVRLRFGCRADDLGVRERAQFARVVGVLVRNENLRDLLRLVAEVSERFEIGLDLCAKIDLCVWFGRSIGEFGGKASIDEDDLATGIDDPVLQAGALLDRRVKPFCAFSTQGERLRHKAVFRETDGLYCYAQLCFPSFGVLLVRIITYLFHHQRINLHMARSPDRLQL